MEIVRGIVLGLMLLGVIFIIVSIYNSDENKEKREESYREYRAKIKDFEDKTIEYNIVDNIKCRVSGINLGYSLVATNDNKLYLVSRTHLKLEQIDNKKILDAKVEYKISKKTKRKIMFSKKPFDITTKFDSCTLNLILRDRVISIYYTPNFLSDGCLEREYFKQDKYQARDSMENMRRLIKYELKGKN